MKKRILTAALALLIAMTMLAACSNSGTPAASSAPSATSAAPAATSAAPAATSAAPEAPPEDDPDKAYWVADELTTITILTDVWGEVPITADMTVLQEVQRLTNTKWEMTNLPFDATTKVEKFNLIMASQDLPDIIAYNNRALLLQYAAEGAFMPLDDLIAEYGPNMKAAMDNPLPGTPLPYVQDTWAEAKGIDGKVYIVPGISAANAIGAVYSIRQDWLDTLGEEIPETIDELYNVLVRMRDEDPNGNGQQDEVPFTAGGGGKIGAITPMVNAFDAHRDFYIDSNKTIQYGPLEEAYKNGIEFINKLYTEKILEPDFITMDTAMWQEKISNNTAGFMFGWPQSGIGGANVLLEALDPSYRFVPMLPVASASGQRFKDINATGNLVFPRGVIPATCKIPDLVMKLWDFCYTEKAQELATWGVEGVHFDKTANGNVFRDNIVKNPDYDPQNAGVREGIVWIPMPYMIGWDGQYAMMNQSQPASVAAWDLYRDPLGIVEPPMPPLPYTNDEMTRRTSLMSEVSTVRDAWLSKAMVGEATDSHETMVENLKRAGIEEVLQIMNAAYDRLK